MKGKLKNSVQHSKPSSGPKPETTSTMSASSLWLVWLVPGVAQHNGGHWVPLTLGLPSRWFSLPSSLTPPVHSHQLVTAGDQRLELQPRLQRNQVPPASVMVGSTEVAIQPGTTRLFRSNWLTSPDLCKGWVKARPKPGQSFRPGFGKNCHKYFLRFKNVHLSLCKHFFPPISNS